MNLVNFLKELSIKGWKLWIEGERLRYRAPEKEISSLVLAQLKHHKEEIFQLLCDNSDILNVYPLSFGQKALWFLWQLAPESYAYNASFPFPLRICSAVDITAMEKAFRVLVERHPILRTTFHKLESEPIQQVHQNQELDFLQINASAWSEDELKAKVAENQQIPFDLERGPVMRVRLFTLSNKEHVLLLTIHHIACDGWSMDLLTQELLKLYQEQKAGVKTNLPSLRHSYQDYVCWQRGVLEGTEGERLWNYWQQKLAGELPVLNLPTDRPRSAIQNYNGASHKFKLSSSLTEQLKRLAQSSGVTFYMILLAAFMVLLYRYTAQEDILVGSPTSGRSKPEFVPILGYFVDPIVIRADLSKNIDFKEFLTQVRNTVVEGLTHQDYPFALLVEKLQPHRNPSHSPVFQAFFALQKLQKSQDIQKLYLNDIEEDIEWGGLKLRPFEIPHQEGLFDLDLEMMEGRSSIFGDFKYNTDLFDETTIERMVAHFQNLLLAIVENPQLSVSELPLLSEAERDQLLVEWNNTQTDYPKGKSIHQLFEEQVEKTPDALAVVFNGDHLTYKELNSRANQLAHYLQKQGVRPEVLVGICVERSLDMVVGLLGILKAGGAYVPLDPIYPKERLAYMLSDAQVLVLLTQQCLVEKLPEHQATVICLDTNWEAINRESKENQTVEVTANNLAYIIYTSGSTGKPKGVMVPHQAVNRLFFNTNYIQFQSDDRIAQASNISFDAATFEIWGALLHGARLVGISKDILISPQEFALQLREQNINILFLTTALFNQLASNKPQVFKQLRYLLFGGEAVDPKWVKETLTNFAPQQLIHVYGPTESTTFSSWYQVQKVNEESTTIPIGHPISNTQIYLLDSQKQPVPIGVSGEIYIGGDGLARGYLNRPDLTQQRFIPHPFSDQLDACLYKTGDLARYLPDGNIEFLGRIDDQVKIRGFRIELGEIEAVLTQHSAVRETVVIAREDQPGNKRLVAYLVVNNESIEISELRSFLSRELPDYMVPAAFVFLESMPLTPNGKVNRRDLPFPDRTSLSSQAEYVAPSTRTQEVLADIWAEVLGVQQIGIYDNFFELGGHSLLATQAISRLREAFSVELPLSQLFSSPTLLELAKSVELAYQTSHHMSLPAIKPISRESELPLSFAQERLWFLEQLEEGSGTYNIPTAIKLSGFLNVAVLESALKEILRRHEVFRTSFQMINGLLVQVINPKAILTLNLIDLQNLAENKQAEEIQRLAMEDAQKPFDLSQSPLVRASLLHLGKNYHILLFNMHHTVSDGWSLSILKRELSTLYQAFCDGKPSPLKDLPIQYADFAHWQRQYLSGEVLEQQLKYWKKQLAGIPPFLDLPTDYHRPPVQSFQGSTIRIEIKPDLTQKLKALSSSQEVTLFATLLAALKLLLFKWTGQTDIVIGTVIAGRNRSEIEPLIGCFMNFLALRSQVSPESTVQEFLKQVGKTVVEAYSHQDYPFEKLVEALNPTRQMSHNPIYNVALLLQNYPDSCLFGNSIEVSTLEVDMQVAKLDLRFVAQEVSGGILIDCEYNTDLFEAGTIWRMLGHFETLLEELVADTRQRISELPILSEAERQQLLVEWNDTQTDYPQNKCIHQLFEEQAERTPDAVAVVFEDQQLTYRELNHRANQLAHYLQSLGVKTEVLVGICIERSLEIVVGLLGILKAGGAYIPLDPTYPQERLIYMICDSRVPVLLTQKKLVKHLPQHEAQVICLDTEWETIASESQKNPIIMVNPENLAYVIYTSGSTGKPKGAMNTHRGLVNRLLWMQDAYKLTADDRVLQKTPFSFDVSVWEFFWPLIIGSQLVVAEPGGHQDSKYLVKLIAQQQITTLHFVPSMLQVFLEEKGLETCSTLRQVICSGEALPFDLQERFFERLGNCELHNLYGPTEAAIDVTSYHCQRGSERKIVPIGRPIANTQIYILDPNLQPVPIGVQGELHIGGVQLARGYLNRPELTQEKFIANPFSEKPGTKLYKTGDVARYLGDGNIEYLGRIDHQVKLRGFRIELGEIEAVLNQNPLVREAVVIAREDEPDNKRLVAYLVPQQEKVSLSQLRQFLLEQLPDYMVPSAFVWLEAMPLTPNGKVDRRSLPLPQGTREIVEGEFLFPRNTLEIKLVEIWETILGTHPIGVKDNFFDLGGHSLLAVQLIAYIEQQFGKNISLGTLFRGATIEKLATILCEQRDSQHWSPLVPIQPLGSKSPFFCIPGVGGNPLYFHNLARYLGYNQPLYGLQALGLDGETQPLTTIEDIAAYYIEAIQTIQQQGPYLLGGHSFGGKIVFEIAQQLLKQGQKVALLAIFDAPAPVYEDELKFSNWDNAKWIIEIAKDFERLSRKNLDVSYEDIQTLNSEEQIVYLNERLKIIGILPQYAGVKQVKATVEVLKANTLADCKYRPINLKSTKITLFRAIDNYLKRIDNKKLIQNLKKPTMGWSELSEQPVELYLVPGNHDTMKDEPHVQILAKKLKICLESLQTND